MESFVDMAFDPATCQALLKKLAEDKAEYLDFVAESHGVLINALDSTVDASRNGPSLITAQALATSEVNDKDATVVGLARSNKRYLDTITQIHNALVERLTRVAAAATTATTLPSPTKRYEEGSQSEKPETGASDRRRILAFYDLADSDTDEDEPLDVQELLRAEHYTVNGLLA